MLDAGKETRIDERRAAILIGLSMGELRQLARQAALGHTVTSESCEQLFFTYEELCRLCLLAARSNG